MGTSTTEDPQVSDQLSTASAGAGAATVELSNFGAPPAQRTPLIVIEPPKAWQTLNLRELWAHRELLYYMIWRDVKVRYKQTALGIAWAVIQPFFTMLIFTIFFGRLAAIPSDNIPYPIFAYAGLLPWTFFSNAVTNSSNSLVGSSHLITKVYF
ncbi:MAG TPA: ABC transporter permease, partial [Pyrinomonadaceae bacterium]|nr:ABC transporter permease [Pyrinomonadaceae bacterium]